MLSLNQFEPTNRRKNVDTIGFMWQTCRDPIQIIRVKLNNDRFDNFEAEGERNSGKQLFSLNARAGRVLHTPKVIR